MALNTLNQAAWPIEQRYRQTVNNLTEKSRYGCRAAEHSSNVNMTYCQTVFKYVFEVSELSCSIMQHPSYTVIMLVTKKVISYICDNVTETYL